MSQGYGTDISLVAGADLSAKQFYFVKVDNAGKAVLAGDGEDAIGVLQNKPAADQVATVRVSGKSKIVQGATQTIGTKVASNGSGKGVLATTGENVMGILVENGGADLAVGAIVLNKNGLAA